MIKRAFIKFHDLPLSIKALIAGVFVVIAFGIGAVFEDRVQKITGDQPGDQAIGVSWILLLLIIAALWGLLKYQYHRALESHNQHREAHRIAIEDAREKITRLNVQQLARCDAIMGKDTVSIDELRSVLICEVDRIAELISAAWGVVNSHHNVSITATERINFEMTLITPSLRDSELTIASWCNRDNLRPKSLLLRDQEDTKIYARTEAAKMISKRVTDTIVIEDTSDPTKNYEHLYEGQKERIRSSVLHPILSPKNEHLAVLVLHCEQARFFRDDDRRYWHELFSVFAPSIALELERIKAFNKAASDWPGPPTEKYQPY